MANNKNLSKLWKTEDWLAVWIGFIVIAIGIVAVLTKAFDFSALTFKTWTWGESLTDAQMASYFGPIPLISPDATWDSEKAQNTGMTYLYGSNWQKLYGN